MSSASRSNGYPLNNPLLSFCAVGVSLSLQEFEVVAVVERPVLEIGGGHIWSSEEEILLANAATAAAPLG